MLTPGNTPLYSTWSKEMALSTATSSKNLSLHFLGALLGFWFLFLELLLLSHTLKRAVFWVSCRFLPMTISFLVFLTQKLGSAFPSSSFLLFSRVLTFFPWCLSFLFPAAPLPTLWSHSDCSRVFIPLSQEQDGQWIQVVDRASALSFEIASNHVSNSEFWTPSV